MKNECSIVKKKKKNRTILQNTVITSVEETLATCMKPY